MDKLLTLKEVAIQLRMSTLTIKRWCRSGYIKGVRIGRRGDWRIKEADLIKYLEVGKKV